MTAYRREPSERDTFRVGSAFGTERFLERDFIKSLLSNKSRY